jgi:hypothetical protein
MERLPTEIALTQRTREFKAISREGVSQDMREKRGSRGE